MKRFSVCFCLWLLVFCLTACSFSGLPGSQPSETAAIPSAAPENSQPPATDPIVSDVPEPSVAPSEEPTPSELPVEPEPAASEEPEVTGTDVPFFEEHFIDCSYVVGDGWAYLDTGAAYFNPGGANYTLTPNFWEITENSRTTGSDGRVEYRFTAIAYLPAEYDPLLDGAVEHTAFGVLFDLYTGTWFSGGQVWDESVLTEDAVPYTVKVNGKSVRVDVGYYDEWVMDIQNCSAVLYRKYAVRYPADYNGLAFGMLPEAETYEQWASLLELSEMHNGWQLSDYTGVDLDNAIFSALS